MSKVGAVVVPSDIRKSGARQWERQKRLYACDSSLVCRDRCDPLTRRGELAALWEDRDGPGTPLFKCVNLVRVACGVGRAQRTRGRRRELSYVKIVPFRDHEPSRGEAFVGQSRLDDRLLPDSCTAFA